MATTCFVPRTSCGRSGAHKWLHSVSDALAYAYTCRRLPALAFALLGGQRKTLRKFDFMSLLTRRTSKHERSAGLIMFSSRINKTCINR